VTIADWVVLALSLCGLIVALALCGAAARGDDILAGTLDRKLEDHPPADVIDIQTRRPVDLDTWPESVA
jgi:hypothetical protein